MLWFYPDFIVAAILVLYMTSWLGFDNDLATEIFHTYVVSAYVMPLFGAMLADGVLGKYTWDFSIAAAREHCYKMLFEFNAWPHFLFHTGRCKNELSNDRNFLMFVVKGYSGNNPQSSWRQAMAIDFITKSTYRKG